MAGESSTATAAKRPAAKRPSRPARPLEALRSDLAEMYTGIGLLLKPMLPLPALVLVRQSEACAEAWARAAEVNPLIRRALEGFSTASVYGALLMAHAPIAIAFQVQLGSLDVRHPLAAQIRPEIELVIEENERMKAATEAAGTTEVPQTEGGGPGWGQASGRTEEPAPVQ